MQIVKWWFKYWVGGLQFEETKRGSITHEQSNSGLRQGLPQLISLIEVDFVASDASTSTINELEQR
jgi:hypothetical protein